MDAVTDESDTTNNCSSSVEVNVPEPQNQPQDQIQGNPDLVVVSPSVSDSAPTAGTKFTLSATVRNDGDGASEATTLRYYHSTDTTITTSDTEIGADALPGLGVSGSSSGSMEVTAQSTPGTYHYGACVDAVTDESDETNNCSSLRADRCAGAAGGVSGLSRPDNPLSLSRNQSRRYLIRADLSLSLQQSVTMGTGPRRPRRYATTSRRT